MKVGQIIKKARGTRSQADFSRSIGKSQGLISKYERGVVSPPSNVLEKCLDILQVTYDPGDVSVDALVKRVSSELRGPQFAYARKSIVALLDGLRSVERP